MVSPPARLRACRPLLQVSVAQGFFPCSSHLLKLERAVLSLYNSRRPNQDDFQVARKHAAKVVETKVGKRGD